MHFQASNFFLIFQGCYAMCFLDMMLTHCQCLLAGQEQLLVNNNTFPICRTTNGKFCFCNLTLNVPIATKVVCFSRLLLYGKQCGPRSDCSYSGSTLFASIFNWSVMLGNYLQQTTPADDIFRCTFFLEL